MSSIFLVRPSARAGEPARRALVNRAAYSVSASGFDPWRDTFRDIYHRVQQLTPDLSRSRSLHLPRLRTELDSAVLGPAHVRLTAGQHPHPPTRCTAARHCRVLIDVRDGREHGNPARAALR